MFSDIQLHERIEHRERLVRNMLAESTMAKVPNKNVFTNRNIFSDDTSTTSLSK